MCEAGKETQPSEPEERSGGYEGIWQHLPAQIVLARGQQFVATARIEAPEMLTSQRRRLVEVDKRAHSALMGHRPCVVWFTGISGAGKSTIAHLVEGQLHAAGRHTCLLDGDDVRHGLNGDLGFSDADRVENIRRIGEVSKLMVDAGLIVLVAFISPFRAGRAVARGLVEAGEFCEVFVDTSLEVAEARDVKGLYARARRGDLPGFTGIDSPYERPDNPELRIDTCLQSPHDAADAVVAHLGAAGVLA